ncbi:MAG: HlyD family efflux transporter periplasmic adaptor subunit [Acidiferrobacterales bacterium]|nr:HlyD family efflux transporter periplasmic adaptor subunit [Acidiferrobacterales bacterium]
MNISNDISPSTALSHPSEDVLTVDYQHWVNLADSSNREQYFESWLAIICGSIPSALYASVLVNQHDDLSVAAIYPETSDGLSAELRSLCDDALSERRALVAEPDKGESTTSTNTTIVAYPLTLDEGVAVVVAMEVSVSDDESLTGVLHQLQLGSAWLELLFRREESVADDSLVDQALGTLGLLTRVSEHKDAQDAATELVTSLATALNCERVILGTRKGNIVKVVAISNSGQFGRKMNLIRLCEQAMLESIDQQVGLRMPNETQNVGQVVLRHQALLDAFKSSSVMTVPFNHDKKWAGAILLERNSEPPFSAEEFDLVETTVSVAGGLIVDKQRADRSLFKLLKDRFLKFSRNTLRIAYPIRTLVILGFIAVVLFGSLVEGQFSVKGNANLEGLIERSVVAPFDGYIEVSKKRVGDLVSADELLGQMDASQFQLELIELSSKKAQSQSQIRESQASGDRAEVNVLQTQVAQVDAQIALLNKQLERAALTAPYDGYIVRGDLSRELGAAVSRGDVLFVIAPLKKYRVVMQISEKEIAFVEEGKSAELILSAFPSEVISFSVNKITPVATAAEGLNSFRVEAEITDETQQLRPGMRGVVRIDGGKKKWIWIWTREFVDWVRVTFWRWMP